MSIAPRFGRNTTGRFEATGFAPGVHPDACGARTSGDHGTRWQLPPQGCALCAPNSSGAPLANRIERIMSRESVDRQTAEWLAEKVDSDRRCFVHSLYGKNWDEEFEYDRLFDTSKTGVDEVVATVKELLAERDRNVSEEAKKTLEMRAAAARIKAGLLTDARLFVPSWTSFLTARTSCCVPLSTTPKSVAKSRRLAENWPANSLSGVICSTGLDVFSLVRSMPSDLAYLVITPALPHPL